jgi:putative endonuclease
MIPFEHFYFVYVLRSQKDRLFYTGYTSDIQNRFDQHCAGQVESTANRRPLELIYWEACLSRQDAIRREKYLKSTWGKRYLKSRLNNYLTGSPHETVVSELH